MKFVLTTIEGGVDYEIECKEDKKKTYLKRNGQDDDDDDEKRAFKKRQNTFWNS